MILTHYAPHSDPPWIAIDVEKVAIKFALFGLELNEKERTDILRLMANYCALLDEENLIGGGMTEQEAIADIP